MNTTEADWLKFARRLNICAVCCQTANPPDQTGRHIFVSCDNCGTLIPLRLTAVGACAIVISALFIVPLNRAWVGILNATIATGGVWITAILAWWFKRKSL
jgi:hypothetical protein